MRTKSCGYSTIILSLPPVYPALGLAEHVADSVFGVLYGEVGTVLVGDFVTPFASVKSCHFGSSTSITLVVFNTFDEVTPPRHVFLHTLFDLVPMRLTFPSSSRINMCCPILSDETGLPESLDTSSTRSLAYIHSPLGSAFSMASIM